MLIAHARIARNRLVNVLAAGVFVALGAAVPAAAQGLSDEGAIEAIIGSEVDEAESEAGADAEKVIAAIERSTENQAIVRRTTVLEKVEIVYLADAAISAGGPPAEIQEKVDEHADAIAGLRQEIEGNAMLYHAIDSRQILIRDILALDFGEGHKVVIYAGAAPPG